MAGGWRLVAGGWRLEAGGWRLEAGGRGLEAEGRRPSMSKFSQREKEKKPDAQKKVSMKRKCSTSCPGGNLVDGLPPVSHGPRRCRAASKEIAGGQGKPRAPEIPGYPSGERVVRLLGTPGRGREQRSNVAIARDVFAASRWLQKVSSCVQGGLRRSGEASSSSPVSREPWERPGS